MFVLLAGIEMYFNLHTGNINLQTGIHWIIRFQLMTESRVLRQMRSVDISRCNLVCFPAYELCVWRILRFIHTD